MSEPFLTFKVKGEKGAAREGDRIAKGLQTATVQGVTRATVAALREVRHSATRKLDRRTGKFMSSFRARVTINAATGAASGIVFSDHPGAAIQEFGGTVRGKRGPMTVPLSNEAQQYHDSGKNRSGFGDRLVIKRSGSAAHLVEKLASQTIFHYVLRKSVKLKARHYFSEGFKKAVPKVAEELGTAYQAVIKG